MEGAAWLLLWLPWGSLARLAQWAFPVPRLHDESSLGFGHRVRAFDVYLQEDTVEFGHSLGTKGRAQSDLEVNGRAYSATRSEARQAESACKLILEGKEKKGRDIGSECLNGHISFEQGVVKAVQGYDR